MDINDLTGTVIGAAIEVHKTIGPLAKRAVKICHYIYEIMYLGFPMA
jgi:hypothetical protein